MFASSRKAKLLWRVGCLLDKLLHSTTRQCVTTGSDLGGSSAPSASIQSFASVARRALAKPKPTFPKADLFYPQMYRSLISSFCASRFPGVGGGVRRSPPPRQKTLRASTDRPQAQQRPQTAARASTHRTHTAQKGHGAATPPQGVLCWAFQMSLCFYALCAFLPSLTGCARNADP